MIRSAIDTLWDRWANLHPFLRFLLLSAVVAALAWFTARPIYRTFKAWRMERNLVAARQAVAEVRMDEARDLSLSVLRAGDPRLEAYQILEKSTAALRDPMHGDIARALMAHPQSSDEDRLNGFRGIAPDVALGFLGQIWGTLPTACQQDPRFATLFADRLIAEPRLGEAAAVLLAVPEAARTGAVNRRLIRVLIGSGKGEGYGEAQRLIAAQMPADGTELAEWLDLLETLPALSLRPGLLEAARRALEPAAGDEQARPALMLARIDYAARFPECAAVLEAAISRWQERSPKALADFLGDLGLYQRLLEIFPPQAVEQHPELFPRVLQAMERGGAWAGVIPLLDKHGRHLPKFEELAHRAVAAAKLSDSPGRAVAWNAAMAEAKTSAVAVAYLTLQRLASEVGMSDEAEQAMVAAIRLGRGPLPLYVELKPLLTSLARQGRDSTLLEVCASYLAFEPGNPVLMTQFAYLACLNNVVEPKTILKAMEALAGGYAKDLTIQCVLATAYLCDGQAAKAAATLDALELEPAKLPPGLRAAFLTIQVLSRRIAKDDPRITEFPWKSLQPCERKKFSELLRNAESHAKAGPAAPAEPKPAEPKPAEPKPAKAEAASDR